MVIKYEKFIEGKIYQDILKSYGDTYDVLSKKRGVKPNSEGYFEELPAHDFVEDLITKYYKPGFKFLDIGCGLGNILRLANEIGYKSTGIEINTDLKKHHNGLNVIYGDVLKLNTYNFLRDFDVIYLYRPINDIVKSNKLFEILHKYCKNECKILYVLPSPLDMNLKRKFKYELFPVYRPSKYEFGKPTTMIDTGKTTINPLNRSTGENYNVLTPIYGVKDIDVGKILDDGFKKLDEFEKNIIVKKTGSNIHKFICRDKEKMDYFLDRVLKVDEFFKEKELDITMISSLYEYSSDIDWIIKHYKMSKNRIKKLEFSFYYLFVGGNYYSFKFY
jgi:SAM-dependent methyltransferase